MKIKLTDTPVKILITAILIILVIRNLSLERIASLIGSIDTTTLLPVLLAAVVFVLLKWCKWHLLLIGRAESLTPSLSIASYLIGTAAGLVTPGRVGELGRAALFKGDDRARVAGLVIFDRMIDLVTVAVYALVGLFAVSRLLGTVALAGIIILTVVIFGGDSVVNLLSEIPLFKGLLKRFRGLEVMLQGWGGFDRRRLMVVMVISFLAFGVSLVQFHFLSEALFPRASLLAALVSFPVLVLASAAPFTVSGFGAREAVAVLMMGRYAIPREVAVSATLLSFTFNVAVPGLAGAVFLQRIGGDKTDISV
ncbi:MAG: lysylphosphatidylglycerol synthase transmembrane domain-containing protein [bacterium]|jgi:uncharacterized membrane protein YbhN (UPF0104 family)|nr:lysylphosphatidylglycerol synthase transmembrane domain-containing protein [bacterium]MDD3805057.1 lysylphosphatidylglycerol synthase transmembrane domain-containing protein [bacterium]MDD4153157.1 lysylphosphatidylglycerol synthase transmembrane domain-containing protein [bacterium]MDD4558069.1 lysylphosphatidylglycerol synthase transmembrane domain-containing protein [bacterium]